MVDFQIAPRILIAAICGLLSAASLAQERDLAGWEQTSWGMTAQELGEALGADLLVRPLGNGRTEYSSAGYRIGGHSFDVSFVWNFEQRLMEIRVGSGFVAFDRTDAAAAVEAALVEAHGRFTYVIADRTVDEDDTHSVIRKLEWGFPTTTIVFHHYLTVSPAGTFDALTVRYLATGGL